MNDEMTVTKIVCIKNAFCVHAIKMMLFTVSCLVAILENLNKIGKMPQLKGARKARGARKRSSYLQPKFLSEALTICSVSVIRRWKIALMPIYTIKTKVAFWRAGFYPANQKNLKNFQKALFGWKKPALQKSHFCFDYVNRL